MPRYQINCWHLLLEEKYLLQEERQRTLPVPDTAKCVQNKHIASIIHIQVGITLNNVCQISSALCCWNDPAIRLRVYIMTIIITKLNIRELRGGPARNKIAITNTLCHKSGLRDKKCRSCEPGARSNNIVRARNVCMCCTCKKWNDWWRVLLWLMLVWLSRNWLIIAM